MTPALGFRAIAHAYDGKPALRGVDLDVAPGEIVALLGPSGCGKTTLLRIGAGLEQPDSGAVTLGGRVVADDHVFTPAEKRGVGLMFQDYALFPHLDVAANVGFGLKGRPAAERARIVGDLLAHVGLADRGGAYPHMLSGGVQQRIALARALAPQPAVLLMDEPFSNLDQRLRRGMRAQTAALLREAGAAGVLVTHDPDDAMATADRIALMREGRIVQIGAPMDIFRRPNSLFAARFFSDLEEIPAGVRAGRATTPLGSFSAPDLPDGPALVCIRRDAFSLRMEEAEFAATVRDVRFLGDRLSVQLQIEGFAPLVEALIDARLAQRAIPGERVGVALDRTEVFVFSSA